jgi:uncharacterized protein YaiI (UPF0178 family)
MWQQMAGDTSTANLVLAKRDINEGCAVFMNRLGRKFNKEYITGNLVLNQQYYQLPSGVLRISEVKCLSGSTYFMPQLVTSEEEWNNLNATTNTGSYPTHYYIRGFNEVGLYPIPSANVTDGLVVSYEPQHVDLTQDDITTGTVTVSNGSQTITHSGTSFTPQMVGRYLQITDGTDGKWYKIGAYTSSSVLSLENYYEGISGSGRTYKIGEVCKLPQGYQDAPVYYALERYYLMQNDPKTAIYFTNKFREKLKDAKQTYGHSTSRLGVKTRSSGRKANWLDLTPPVSYP